MCTLPEATFPLFCMHVAGVFGPQYRTLIRSLLIFISLQWTGLFNFSRCVWILVLLFIQWICSPSELHVTCTCDDMLPLPPPGLVMMPSRKEDSTLYGQAICPSSQVLPEWEDYSSSLLLFDPPRHTRTVQCGRHSRWCPHHSRQCPPSV